MNHKTDRLMVAARRAYELGRLRAALRWLVPVSLLATAAFFACGSSTLVGVLAVSLAAVTVAADWRGTGWARGIKPGLIAGTGAFLLPVVVENTIGCPTRGAGVAMCLTAGLGAGWLGARTARKLTLSHQAQTLFSTGLITALAAGLGCAILGVAGVIGATVGVVSAVAPFYLFAKPSH